jgi:hypothetical protein
VKKKVAVKVVAANESLAVSGKTAVTTDTVAKVHRPADAANEPGDKPAPTANRKRTAGRRGIQLKSLGKSGGDGLN